MREAQLVPPDLVEQLGRTLEFSLRNRLRDRWADLGQATTLILDNQAAIMSELCQRRRGGQRWSDRTRHPAKTAKAVGTRKRS